MRKLSRRGKVLLVLLAVPLLLAAGLGLWMSDDGITRLPPTPAQRALAEAAAKSGADRAEAWARADGGTLLGGTIEGRQFAVAIPPNWNHQALVFAHGYSAPGSSVRVSADPAAKDPGGSLMKLAYGQGFAVGHSAYAKPGVGVEAGVKATLALKQLLDRLGTTRTYLAGASMGGTITVTLAEEYPGEFAGALAACGPGDWKAEIAGLIDFRALYNYFASGTKYALPGNQSIKVSAIAVEAPWALGFAQPVWTGVQMKRMASPIEALFADARKDPDGEAARIIRNVSSASGEFGPEFASFALPLLTASLGQDDMVATMRGHIYDNRARVYRSAWLSDAGNAALNRGIERVAADSAAVAYARQWHEPSGRSSIKIVTIHNAVDSLVPWKRQVELARKMAEAGNSANLLTIRVPTKTGRMPLTSFEGIAHCGFEPAQVAAAWKGLRSWVETGAKPVTLGGR